MDHLIIGGGGVNDIAAIPLSTRRSTHIRNETRPEMPPEQLKAAIELLNATFPNASLRSATARYNCMGLVFASRRTHIDIELLSMILREDGYHKLTRKGDVVVGDLVVYRNHHAEVTHVAVVIEKTMDVAHGEVELKVLSKWGLNGEYIHDAGYIPFYLGKPSEYWTDRKTL